MIAHGNPRVAVKAIDHHAQQFAQGAGVGVGDAVEVEVFKLKGFDEVGAAAVEGLEIAFDERPPDAGVQAGEPP